MKEARMALKAVLVMLVACGTALAQQRSDVPNQTPPTRQAQPKRAQPQTRYVESGSGVVGVNSNQPYRPIPANQAQSRVTIFEFYLRALNPRQIKWGDELDRRLAVLAEHSVKNPYFRVSALETAAILLLLLTCWAWWDKMRQIKWIAAECLADAINAKLIADQKALEAIGQYNRHMEMCNRVIEEHNSGITSGKGTADWQRELRDLQTQLATERTQSARLAAELKSREELQTQLERRLAQMETLMRERRDDTNAELVARLQRAEAELAGRKPARK
jgi:hypothetical protein